MTDLLPLDVRDLPWAGDDENRYCTCGYNLRGLPAARACPECGSPPAPPVGLCLWHADVGWLNQLRLGVILLLGHFFACAPAILMFAAMADRHQPCMNVPWLLPPIVVVLGVWRLTIPEPGVRTQLRSCDVRLNLLTRRLAIAWLGFLTLRCGVDIVYRLRNVYPLDDANTTRLDVATALVCVAWTVLIAARLASIGRRVNSGMLTHGGAVVCILIAWGVFGGELGMFLYRHDIIGYGWLAELQGSAYFAMFFGSTLTIGFLTFYWIAINLAIDGTTLQLRRANIRPRRRPARDDVDDVAAGVPIE